MNREPQGLGSDSSEGHRQHAKCLGSTMKGREGSLSRKPGLLKFYLKICGHFL